MSVPTTPADEPETGAPTAATEEPDPRRWKALAVLAAAQLMIVLDASIVNIALAVVGMLWLTQIDATTSYTTHVLPSQLLMSVGLAGVFIPAASTALIGVGHHDAGVASAVLNTSQQIGGSLGTALLNTIFAGAVTAYLTDHVRSAADAQRMGPDALIHGYQVAFFWGAILFAAALVIAATLINAKKEDIPAETAAAAA